MSHSVAWHVAQPLWEESLADGDADHVRFRAPVILRFKGDDFMDQLKRALGADSDVAALVLRAESWRGEAAGWLDTGAAAGAPVPKLYQPAHYRFYLVSASLVCQQPGLPDRRVEASHGESVSFVIRRLFPRDPETFDARAPSTYDEYGWFGTAQDGSWRPVPVRGELAPREERIPLFPSRFETTGAPRRLLAGLVPVARRDVYEAGAARAAAPASAGAAAGDPFATEDLAAAAEQVLPALEAFADPGTLVPPVAASAAAEAAQLAEEKVAVAHALLVLLDFVEQRCAPVWQALGDVSGAKASALAAGPRALYDRLASVATGTSITYGAILAAVEGGRSTLTDGDPDAAFVDGLMGGASLDRTSLRVLVRDLSQGLGDLLDGALADPRAEAFQAAVGGALTAAAAPAPSDDAAQDKLLDALLALADFLRAEFPTLWSAVAGGDPAGLAQADRAVYDLLAGSPLDGSDWRTLLADADAHRLDVLGGRITPAVKVVGLRLSAAAIAASAASVASPLGDRIAAALAAHPPPAIPAATLAVTGTPAKAPAAPTDAAYVIRCVYERPRCKGFADTVVSEPTAPFQLASFFDADAPVRPTRILMPDVTLKALRRAPRGVQIALSKELRAQIERVRGIGLDDLGKGKLKDAQGFDLGLVCSLSIPIITIVALMLLIIIVSLLNIVFWWLPFFILCLPRIGRRS